MGLAGIILLASLPLMTDYLLNSSQLMFQLNRIEGLKEGLISGQFPVRIQYNWLDGNGYGVSIFQGDLFLLVPALLRIAGFSVQAAYKIFLLLLNTATAFVAYACFRGSFQDRVVGLLGSMLYTWMPYRLNVLYGSAGLGEGLALVFLPSVLYGIYRVFYDDESSENYRRVWLLPAAGLAGMLLSHVITAVLAGIMVLFLSILHWRKLFRKSTLLAFLKGIAALVVWTGWFLLPYGEYLVTDNLNLRNVFLQRIQYKGLYFLHYLFAFFRSGASESFDSQGMVQTAPLGIGFAVTICLIICLWLLFIRRYRDNCRDNTPMDRAITDFGKKAAIVGILCMLLSLKYFPWDYLQQQNKLFALLIAWLQSPAKWVGIAALCFIFVSCLLVDRIRKWESRITNRIFVGGLIFIAFFVTQFLIGDFLYTGQPIHINSPEELDDRYILDGEYLPAGVNAQELTVSYEAGPGVDIILPGGVDSGTESEAGAEAGSGADAGTYGFYGANTGTAESYVDLPLLYYKGYRAVTSNHPGVLQTDRGDNGRVRVILPAGFTGNVMVSFVSPWYWRAAEGISLLGIFSAAIYLIYPKGMQEKRRLGESKEKNIEI